MEYDLSQQEIALIELLSRLPADVQRAAAELRPLYIANSAYELAKAFNDFVIRCPVLTADTDMRLRSRLAAAARVAIANSLALPASQPQEAM